MFASNPHEGSNIRLPQSKEWKMSWRFFQEVPDGVWIYKKSNKIVQLLFCLGKSKNFGGSQILSGRYFWVSELISGGDVCNPNRQLRDQYVGAWANHRYPLRAMTHMDPGNRSGGTCRPPVY